MDRPKSFSGKTAVVTGATSGIGLASAHLLAQHGLNIIGIGRNAHRCQKAEAEIKAACQDANIKFLLADLSNLSQVRSLADNIAAELAHQNIPCLDILVNNAGTYSQKKIMTADDIELTFATNHLATFLLTLKLLPAITASPTGRIITVSSDSHYGASINPQTAANPSIYFGLQAYASSKLANVLFTAELNRRMTGTRVHAYAVDPGLVKTEIALKGQPLFSRILWKLRSSSGVEPDVPARCILFLASDKDIQNSLENYWYNSQPKRCSPQAARPDLARELWQVSSKLCGLNEKQQENN
jgi:retinol dehydrogenase 12